VEASLVRLVRAQKLEERLVVLKRRAEGLPVELSERGAQVSALEAEADQAEGERRAALSKAQDLENDVRVREQRVAKLQKQIEETRDAAAAKVAEHEAAELRVRCAEAQDQALGLLERAETLHAHAAEVRVRVAAAREDLARFRATVEADAAGLREEIASFTSRRDALLDSLDAATRDHFAAVGKRTPGKVVAPLKGDSCGGCGTRMVPNDAVRVRAKSAWFRCPSCARFLVAPEVWAAAEQESQAAG
jgi:predicted  nucleic acid-binding Zn-ribbon protein